MNKVSGLTKRKTILYVILNFILGIPLYIMVWIVSFRTTGADPSTLVASQQYLALVYFIIWFAVNSIILSPMRKRSIILFLFSPFILMISTIIALLFIVSFFS